jgi:hypothetical protein
MVCAQHGVTRRAAVAVVAAIALALGIGIVALPASAGTQHRAAVVVEVDGVIHTGKVSFSGDSISGLDAMRGAGFDPLVRVFGANGGAVCAIDVNDTTIGCPADGTCLTCDQPRYWAYFRAHPGATSYTYSITGAGLTQVHDGDVEAWVWGTGSPPSRFVSFADVWGPDPTTTTRVPVTTTPTTTSTTTRASSPPTVGGAGPLTTNPAASVPTVAGSTATTVEKPTSGSATVALRKGSSSTATDRTNGSPETSGDTRRVASAPVVARGGGGSPYGLVGFAAVIAALLGAIAFARRRRVALGGESR